WLRSCSSCAYRRSGAPCEGPVSFLFANRPGDIVAGDARERGADIWLARAQGDEAPGIAAFLLQAPQCVRGRRHPILARHENDDQTEPEEDPEEETRHAHVPVVA